MRPSLALKAARMVVVQRTASAWHVLGDHDIYTVQNFRGKMNCTCPSWGKTTCSHLLAVQFHTQQRLSATQRKEAHA